MKTGAEAGGMRPQAKEHREHQELEGAKKDPPRSLWKECSPADTLIFGFLVSRTVWESISVVCSPYLWKRVTAAPGNKYIMSGDHFEKEEERCWRHDPGSALKIHRSRPSLALSGRHRQVLRGRR